MSSFVLLSAAARAQTIVETQRGAKNLAFVNQSDPTNAVHLKQFGTNNLLSSTQNGSNNDVELKQRGSNNRAIVDQTGNDNTSNIVQSNGSGRGGRADGDDDNHRRKPPGVSPAGPGGSPAGAPKGNTPFSHFSGAVGNTYLTTYSNNGFNLLVVGQAGVGGTFGRSH